MNGAGSGQQVTIDQAIQLARRHAAAKRFADAESILRQVTIAAPGRADALNDLGMLLGQHGKYAEAEQWLRRATQVDPRFCPAWHNLAVAAEHQGKLEEAVAFVRKAIEYVPNYWENHYRLAQGLKKVGRYDEAIVACHSALRLNPGEPETRGILASMSLITGDFETGWREYEARWECPSFPDERRDWSKVRARDTDLRGKRVVVVSEQGYGDIIQFARYVPMLADLGADVVVVCPVDIAPLFKWVRGIKEVTSVKGAVPGDYVLPMMSLPLVFDTKCPADVPANIPYINPPADRLEKWRTKVDAAANRAALKIGIAWAGRPTHKQDKERSVKLARFASLAKVEGVKLFSLQKGPAAAEANPAPAGMTVVNLTGGLADFSDTATFVANLDLVVAVDTAVVHLAGALGKPVWTLLAYAPDWRWLLGRDDSPWYPSMRLFRQPSLGDWDAVFAHVEQELRKLVATRSSP